MDEQTQKEFIAWLADELQVNSNDELEDKLKNIGEEGIQKAFQMFTKQRKTPQSVVMKQNGGALEYIKCLQAFKKGGKMKKASCGCSGAILAKTGAILDKGKDSATAIGGRHDSGKKEHTANKGNDPKGKDGKTALNRRFEQGKKEHTARVTMKGSGGSIKEESTDTFKVKAKLKKLNPKRIIMGQGADGVMGNSKIHG